MTIKNDLQTIKDFLKLGMPYGEQIKQAWHDDKIKLKMNVSFLCDDLLKEGYISEKTCQNAYIYQNKKGSIILTCLSYKLKVS